MLENYCIEFSVQSCANIVFEEEEFNANARAKFYDPMRTFWNPISSFDEMCGQICIYNVVSLLQANS